MANGDSAKSVRTVAEDGRDYRVVAVPVREQGFAVVLAQNMATAGAGPEAAGRRDAAVRPGRRDRRGRRRLGRRAQRPASGTPAHPQRRADRPHRGPPTAAGRGGRRDRPAGDGVQRHAGRAVGVPRPPTPTGRRRRARAAHPADLAAHQPRPAPAGRRGRRARRRRRVRELLDDVRGPDRGDVRPWSATWSSWPATSRCGPSSSRSTSPRSSTGRSPGRAGGAPA